MTEIIIDPSERWLILGKTGSGKTEFAKYMLRKISRRMPVVVIDPKGFWLGKHPDWETRKREPGTVDKPHLVDTFNSRWRVQCLQPDTEEDERLEKLCFDILKHGDIFIYFDEVDGIATANNVPLHIRKIWKTGRALGVGAWAATQVPLGIPKLFKSQAEKFVVFKVGEEDVDLASQLVHTSRHMVQSLKKYEYLFYDSGTMDTAVLMPPIPYKGK
jgi:energy-coupling factor transporter ATP-binding protein EcfA2